jgi:hypothetical protein
LPEGDYPAHPPLALQLVSRNPLYPNIKMGGSTDNPLRNRRDQPRASHVASKQAKGQD